MKTVRVRITGTQPLLLHADSIEWADRMEAWKNDPDNKKKSKPGDDRTPPWRWLGYLTYDDPSTGHVALSAEYLMKAMMGGAVEVPTGKGQKTFKSQSQSGLAIAETHWPLIVRGHALPMAEIRKMEKLSTFSEHVAAVRKMDFDLFVKRAKPPKSQSKHIRVRPRFEHDTDKPLQGWYAEGDVVILDEQITVDVLGKIWTYAGRLKGIGSWRPGGPTPGQFGTFTAEIL